MTLIAAEADLLTALRAVAPDAPRRRSRDQPIITPMVVALRRTAPIHVRNDGPIHPLECVITSELGAPDATDAQYNGVYDAINQFVTNIKGTTPGGFVINWTTGITININVNDAIVEAVAVVPVCERYPRG